MPALPRRPHSVPPGRSAEFTLRSGAGYLPAKPIRGGGRWSAPVFFCHAGSDPLRGTAGRPSECCVRPNPCFVAADSGGQRDFVNICRRSSVYPAGHPAELRFCVAGCAALQPSGIGSVYAPDGFRCHCGLTEPAFSQVISRHAVCACRRSFGQIYAYLRRMAGGFSRCQSERVAWVCSPLAGRDDFLVCRGVCPCKGIPPVSSCGLLFCHSPFGGGPVVSDFSAGNHTGGGFGCRFGCFRCPDTGRACGRRGVRKL